VAYTNATIVSKHYKNHKNGAVISQLTDVGRERGVCSRESKSNGRGTGVLREDHCLIVSIRKPAVQIRH
jgi:hypothetical protein